MAEGVDTSSFDVLVLAGPGLGHYHPIAGLLPELAAPERIAIAAQVPDGHPLVTRAAEDGFTFVPWPQEERRASGRALDLLRRWLRLRVVPRLARSGDAGEALPSVACRTAFALSSLLAPLSDAGAERGRAIDQLLRTTRPRLVLCEGNEDWMQVLGGVHGVRWAYYTTGPVSTVSAGRPVGPAGFAPDLPGGSRMANSILLTAKRLRRARRLRLLDRTAAKLFGAARTSTALAQFAFSAAELDDYPGLDGHHIDYLGLCPYRAPHWWSPTMVDAVTDAERDTVLVTWGSGRTAQDLANEATLLERLLPVLDELAGELRVVVVAGDAEAHAVVSGHDALLAMDPTDAPPYDELRRSRLVITHGGYGTIKEAVALGAALLVVPEVVADRMETAQRVVTAGVGRSVNRYVVDTAHLRTAARAALDDPRVAASVARVGAALRDDARRAALVASLRAAARPTA